jgi:hypothetical protein
MSRRGTPLGLQPRTEASAGAGPRARAWAAAALLFVVLVASSFFFWLGIPALVLWGLSKATESSAQHFVLGLIAVPTAMAAFAPLLFWLNGLYLRVAGAPPVEAGRRRGGLRGPLEYLLLSSLLISFVALLIWFFFFAENPPRQFI